MNTIDTYPDKQKCKLRLIAIQFSSHLFKITSFFEYIRITNITWFVWFHLPNSNEEWNCNLSDLIHFMTMYL